MLIAIGIFLLKYVAPAGIGFGVGRIKNAKKLAAVRSELNKIESGVTSEGKSIVARIRSLV